MVTFAKVGLRVSADRMSGQAVCESQTKQGVTTFRDLVMNPLIVQIHVWKYTEGCPGQQSKGDRRFRSEDYKAVGPLLLGLACINMHNTEW